jgi:RimJ/RimL family protein N-acetyltransferase
MQNDEIVSEVYSAPCGGRIMEIGVTTREAHYGRGYATYLCAYAIRESEQRGYTTYWNSAKQNAASIALARKLGYQSEREYRLLAWFRLK